MPRKSPGGPRDSYLGIRLPERTKFGLTLLARQRHEPVPDVVLAAIHDMFSQEHIGLMLPVPGEEFPKNVLDLVWASRESDRIANLAFRYPSLLSAPEAAIWSRVVADDRFWSSQRKSAKGKATAMQRTEGELLRDVLAEHWQEFADSSTSFGTGR